MHKPLPNVLPLDDYPRQKSCLRAVADIIRHIKAEEGLTNVELAEQIGVSSETVSNAENENNLLNLVTFLRLWFEFGEDAMAPALDLARRRYAEPETPSEKFDRLARELDSLKRETVGS